MQKYKTLRNRNKQEPDVELHFSPQTEATFLINTLSYKEELLKNANGSLIGHKRFTHQTNAFLPPRRHRHGGGRALGGKGHRASDRAGDTGLCTAGVRGEQAGSVR